MCIIIASTSAVYRMACMTSVQRRNIVVLGKTGSGKSTVANRILGKEVFKAKRSLDSVTKEPRQEEAELIVGDVQYKFNLIDTVGLFAPSDSRTNEEIVREAKTFFRSHNIKELNIILFVFKDGRFTDEEKRAFDDIIRHFKTNEFWEISALVVTCCENVDEQGRRTMIEELKENTHTKGLCEAMTKGIFPVGFPTLQRQRNDFQAAYAESVEKDTETLRELIRKSDRQLLCDEILTDSVWEYLQRKCNIL